MNHRLRDYAQLVRLPNAFTAMADIFLGALATGVFSAGNPQILVRFVLVLLASTSLYLAGMVWNDYFDLAQDKRERPGRPLPSGRVTLAAALRLGIGLLCGGLLLAALAELLPASDGQGFRWRTLTIAGCLTAAILLYDGWLKRTLAGPPAMGACRFFNVLLGLSIAGQPLASWCWLLAMVIGLYITGVTWFARTEARVSNVRALKAAAFVMLAGVVLGLAVPSLYFESSVAGLVSAESWRLGSLLFPYLLLAFVFVVGRAVAKAIARPVPERVQPAVKRAILGLVMLDAILATGLVGMEGLAIGLLLLPAMYFGKRLYST